MAPEKKALVRLRDLMPAGFVPLLAEQAGLTDPSAISKLLKYEQHTRRYWPLALALAEETDPAGFALWAAQNPEKLPKVAA